ncbi:MAG: hypothetical protein U1E31_02465 [Rickettsiales bacterium]
MENNINIQTNNLKTNNNLLELNNLIPTVIHYKQNMLLTYENNLIQIIEFNQNS